MTPHRDKEDAPELLEMTREEKESALTNLFAMINSADPPLWAGLPLPEKLPLWKRVLNYLREIFF